MFFFGDCVLGDLKVKFVDGMGQEKNLITLFVGIVFQVFHGVSHAFTPRKK